MERIPRGIYTQKFREQAVRLHEVDAEPVGSPIKAIKGVSIEWHLLNANLVIQ